MKALRNTITLLAGLAIAMVANAAVKPSSPVTLNQALGDAARIAAAHPELKVLRVEGVSMLPYFGQDSVLLVKPTPSASLKPGQVVVYKSNFGETVAHRIIGGDAINGWVVKGYNNATADSTRVTDANLIGTVYVTLFATKGPMMLASAGDLAGSTPVALAAPAR